MKTAILKPLCLLMASLMVITAFISCADTGDRGTDDSEPNTAESSGFNEEKTALENAVGQYKDISYLRDTEFVILSTSPGAKMYSYSGAEENEIYYEEPNSELLSNAIYLRNRKIEDTLGITIAPIWGGSPTDVNTLVTLNDASGDNSFDVIINRVDYEMTYAADGQLLNYYDISSINLENRWWDKTAIDTFTFYGNKLYVISGDINYFDDYAVNTVIFNHELCRSINREFPYQAVRDGKWTMDMMLEMANAVKNDKNGDDVYDPSVDILGLADDNDCMFHFLYSFGQTMSTKNKNGEPDVVWPNDVNVPIVEEIYNIVTADYTFITNDTLATVKNFMNDRILFFTEMLGVLPALRAMEGDFGVLPMPKGDEKMEGYRAYVSNGWSTAFAIPKTQTNADAYDNGVILECMSAASLDIITPALYDKLLESKYIRDPDSREMLTYIFDSKVYDLANDLAWAYQLRTAYKDVRMNGPAYFTRCLTKLKNPLTKSLKDFCVKISEN